MQRYSVVYWTAYMTEDRNGQWVKVKDAEKQLRRLATEVKRLEEALHEAAEMTDFTEDRTLIHNFCKQAAEAEGGDRE